MAECSHCWAAGKDCYVPILQVCKPRPILLHHGPIPNILAHIQGHQLDPLFLLFSFAPCGAQLNLILWLHSELAPGDFSECPMGGGGWGRGVGRTLGRALRLGPPRPPLPCRDKGSCGPGVRECMGATQCPRALRLLRAGVSGDGPAQRAPAGAVELGCLSSNPSPASHRCVTQAHRLSLWTSIAPSVKWDNSRWSPHRAMGRIGRVYSVRCLSQCLEQVKAMRTLAVILVG